MKFSVQTGAQETQAFFASQQVPTLRLSNDSTFEKTLFDDKQKGEAKSH